MKYTLIILRQFRSWRDLDHDGFIDKVATHSSSFQSNLNIDVDNDDLDQAELRSWMMPEEYDQHQAEASHLIHEADRWSFVFLYFSLSLCLTFSCNLSL